MSMFFSVEGSPPSSSRVPTDNPPLITAEDTLEPATRSPSTAPSEDLLQTFPKNFFWGTPPSSPSGIFTEDSLETAPANSHWGTPPRISSRTSLDENIGQDRIEELAQKKFSSFREMENPFRGVLHLFAVPSGSPFKPNSSVMLSNGPLENPYRKSLFENAEENEKAEVADNGEKKISRKRPAKPFEDDLIQDLKRARPSSDSPEPALDDFFAELPGTPIEMAPAMPVETPPAAPVETPPGTPLKTISGEPVEAPPGTPQGDLAAAPLLDITPSPIHVRRLPPSAPKKKLGALFQARAESYIKAMSYYEAGASRLQQTLQNNYPNVDIVIGRSLGEGQFSQVYLLSWNSNMDQVARAVNFQQVIKIPNFQEEDTEGDFIVNRVYEIQNYFQLKEINFPISPYYNLDEDFGPLNVLDLEFEQLKKVVKSRFDGFYRSIFIPQDFLPREELDQLNQQMSALGAEELKAFKQDLKKKNHPIYQVRQMFRLAYQHAIPVDLKQDNVRIQEGKVLLCDLFYEDNDGQNPLDYLSSQKLLTFAAEDSLLWKYLDPRS